MGSSIGILLHVHQNERYSMSKASNRGLRKRCTNMWESHCWRTIEEYTSVSVVMKSTRRCWLHKFLKSVHDSKSQIGEMFVARKNVCERKTVSKYVFPECTWWNDPLFKNATELNVLFCLQNSPLFPVLFDHDKKWSKGKHQFCHLFLVLHSISKAMCRFICSNRAIQQW